MPPKPLLLCSSCNGEIPRRAGKGRQAQKCAVCKARKPRLRLYGRIHACQVCGGLFARKSHDQYRFCSKGCSGKGRLKPKAINIPKVSLACAVCGTAFQTTICHAKRAKYCSLRCGKRANPSWDGRREKDGRLRLRASVCVQCGCDFIGGKGKKLCSPFCMTEYMVERSAHLRAKRICLGCGVLFYRKKKGGGYCSSACAMSVQKKCLVCGAEYVSSAGSKYCPPCYKAKWETPKVEVACAECGCTFKAPESRRFCTKRCLTKYTGRITKGTRRAREKQAKRERISPLVVFHRDGWRCHLCGVSTPRVLMGNIKHPSAPTLDHIVPLAKGGSHTYDNVACCCRKCNSLKGDRILGQMRIA